GCGGMTGVVKAAAAGEPIPLDLGSDLPLPWVYIDDLCAALLAALEAPKAALREVETLAYNVTGPGYPTFREIARIVQRLVPGATIQETGAPDKAAMNAGKMWAVAIKRDLGWEPQVSIGEGVRRLFQAVTAQPAGT